MLQHSFGESLMHKCLCCGFKTSQFPWCTECDTKSVEPLLHATITQLGSQPVRWHPNPMNKKTTFAAPAVTIEEVDVTDVIPSGWWKDMKKALK